MKSLKISHRIYVLTALALAFMAAGGFLIWFLWVQVEPYGQALIGLVTSGMADGSWLKAHLLDSAAHMRLLTMGLILLIVLRFNPRGLIPER